jgi:hypothetical protein
MDHANRAIRAFAIAAVIWLAPAAVRSQDQSSATSAAPASNEAPDTLTIPAGSTIHTVLTTTLSSKNNEVGDPFTAEVTEPIIYHGEEVVPAGSTLEGRVAMVKPAARKGTAEMRLTAESIVTREGVRYSIVASLEDAQGAEGAKVQGQEGTIEGSKKSKKRGAEESGVGAGVGAGAGAIADGGTGALYGAAAGAMAGVVHTLLKKHQDIILPAGTEMIFGIARATTARKTARPGDSQP